MWKILTVAFWVTSLIVSIPFSLIIGLNLVLAPAAIMVGMSIGTAARRVSTWSCPRCDAELVEPEPQEDLIEMPAATPPLAPIRAHV
jgi:hypothetical protein